MSRGDNQAPYAICNVVAEALSAELVVDALGEITGRDLSVGRRNRYPRCFAEAQARSVGALRENRGLIFAPGADTWRGLSGRPIRGLRRSIIINFVSSDCRQMEELTFP